MSGNDKIILEQYIEEQRKAIEPTAKKAEFFEFFVASQILKDHDLSIEEIQAGIVGQGGDGGIDSIHVFANSELIYEDTDLTHLKKGTAIEVVITQAKTGDTYDEQAMNKLAAASNDLLNLTKPLEDLAAVYNESLRGAIATFRRLYLGIATKFPSLHFRYIYATCGDKSTVHPNVDRKVADVERACTSHFSHASASFEFMGAAELLEIARKQPTTTHELEITESFSVKDGYTALVPLKNFKKFITDEGNNLRRSLFESNVRDYQGTTQVNDEIQKSLSERGREDFWWLNNGVTVVANKAVLSGKTLTIEEPQIVNGQQTSTEIYNYLAAQNPTDEPRSVMVRVIVVNDPTSRDRIIKATNSQTSIPPASLRATDKIHRDIEEYFAPFGLYYDRRKNFQKNQGRPNDQIVSISSLAQAVMTILLQRPDSARARPSTLIKKEEDYDQIFSTNYPIEIYLVSAALLKKVQTALKSDPSLAPKVKTNILFYMVMDLACEITGKDTLTPKDIAGIDINKISDEMIIASMEGITALFGKHGGDDGAAKGIDMLIELKSIITARNSKPKGEQVVFDLGVSAKKTA